MRRITITYSVIVVWMFGWLTGTFGLVPSVLTTVILGAPAFFAWRMTRADRPIKRREYGYLGAVTILAVVATTFIIVISYATGLDRLAMFAREYHAFRRHISSKREYENVEVSYTRRKGGCVYLHGAVANKDSHDRLIQTLDRMVRNNDSGYYDRVYYPGKPSQD